MPLDATDAWDSQVCTVNSLSGRPPPTTLHWNGATNTNIDVQCRSLPVPEVAVRHLHKWYYWSMIPSGHPIYASTRLTVGG